MIAGRSLDELSRIRLRGRVEAGKSGGGKFYGYDVIKTIDKDREPARCEHKINKRQAWIVNRIFKDYAAGTSPRTLARQLNAENIPGPFSKAWGPGTIHGNQSMFRSVRAGADST